MVRGSERDREWTSRPWNVRLARASGSCGLRWGASGNHTPGIYIHMYEYVVNVDTLLCHVEAQSIKK